MRIVTKNELLSRDGLCIIRTLIHTKKAWPWKESGEQRRKGEFAKKTALTHLGLDHFRREFVDAIFTPPLERTL